jgi:nitroreductase
MNEECDPETAGVRERKVSSDAEELSPLGVYQEGITWNPVEKIIFERRSIRAFKKDPLPRGVIRRILEAGRFAPSAGNSQPWRFIVINSPEIIAEMERDAMRFVRRIMWVLDYSRSPLRRIFLRPFTMFWVRMFHKILHPVPFAAMMQMARGELGTFFEAPCLILLLEDTRGAADTALGAGIAGQNMVLAAQSLGVGSCWIGFVRLLMWTRFWPRYKRLLGIKYPYKLKEAIALGYPRDNRYRYAVREVLEIPWYEGKLTDKPRIEKQGE